MAKPKILIQLDTDAQPSVFDAVVAIDAEVDHLLRHVSVTPQNVRDLVYGAIFTRGPDDLHRTALFIGGSDVTAGERLLAAVRQTFFGPMRTSVMLDSNGANTTAAAAVVSAGQHLVLRDATALVLGATGPVGQRVVRLLAGEGVTVRVGSRSLERAQGVCRATAELLSSAKLEPLGIDGSEDLVKALQGVQLIIAAGAPGVVLVPAEVRQQAEALKLVIDLNAVPPLGIEGIEATDRAKLRNGVMCYGALGVGRTKMKIHRAAVRQLFESNDQVLDAEQIYQIARALPAT